jgi:tetratricopeptide (TPR) repeat protein
MRLAVADLLSSYVNDQKRANRLYTHVATFDAPDNIYALRRASETYEFTGEYSNAIILEQRRAKLYRVEGGQDEGCMLHAAALQELASVDHITNMNAMYSSGRNSDHVAEHTTPRANAVLGGEVQALSSYQQVWQSSHEPAAFDGMWRCVVRSKRLDGLNYYLAPRTLSHLGSAALVYQAAETLMTSGQLDRAVELLEIWLELSMERGEIDIESEMDLKELIRWVSSVSLGAQRDPLDYDEVVFSWEDYQHRDQAEKLIERLVHEGDWMGAVQALTRLAQLSLPHEQAALWYRIGFYTEVGIRDLAVARSHYRKALRLDAN